eukprot:scpid102285/ scgid26069/ 
MPRTTLLRVVFGQVDLSAPEAFFDARVFNPFPPSNRSSSLARCYQRHEREKRRRYEQRVKEIEHGGFVPLVRSSPPRVELARQHLHSGLKCIASIITQIRV